ncbi:unnamed protein product [Symbiodinium necroappetens]|uniref:Uncharacterized protein n=1 Tax=Symbiodinium necroappetens TaxID=1628268 RepID=A0A812NJU7_9DINO|nr:unnamed protein product [Symbiodinium necroappetens]
MSAQPSVPTPPALEGEETGPNYGQAHQEAREQAAVEDRGERQALQNRPQLNGVDPWREDVVREGPLRAEPRITGPPDEGRNHEQMRREHPPRDEEPHQAERTAATTAAYLNGGFTVTNGATNAVASATSTTGTSGWFALVTRRWQDLGGSKGKLHFYTALQALHLRRKSRPKYSGNFETMSSGMTGRLSA